MCVCEFFVVVLCMCVCVSERVCVWVRVWVLAVACMYLC